MKIIEEEIHIVKKNVSESFKGNLIIDDELKSFVIKGSKYIRSVLAILFFKSQNYDLNDKLYKILCSGELVHNSSLLHDDVIDDAESRRGNTTIAKKYSDKMAILAGDYLLSLAIENLLDKDSLEIVKIFKTCTERMAKAEIDQFFMRDKLPTKDEYIKICTGKTAELFSAILESCAVVLNSDRILARKFGEIFGVCFQIKNDINKDSAVVDKKNGIYTAIDIIGIEKTNILLDNYKEELINIISDFENNLYKEGLKALVRNL